LCPPGDQQAADRMLDKYARPFASGLQDRHACLILGELWINSNRNPPTQADHCRGQHDFIAELPFAGDTFHQRNGGGVIDAELAVKACLGFLNPRNLHHARMQRYINARDKFRQEALAHAQLQAAVDCRMQHEPARERLVGVVQYLPTVVGQCRKSAFAGEHVEPSRFGFDAKTRPPTSAAEFGTALSSSRNLGPGNGLSERPSAAALRRGIYSWGTSSSADRLVSGISTGRSIQPSRSTAKSSFSVARSTSMSSPVVAASTRRLPASSQCRRRR